MQSSEKMKEKLYEVGTAATSTASTLPMYQQISSKDYKKKGRELIRLLLEEQFDNVKKELLHYQSWSKKILEEFFTQEGYDILLSIIVVNMEIPALSFLCQLQKEGIIDSKIFKDFLQKDNYSILDSVMYRAYSRERDNRYDANFQKDQIEMLKLLLKLDYDGVSNFMEKNKSDDFMTKQVKADFQSALKCYREENIKGNTK